MDQAAIETFVHAQVQAWNDHDKVLFFATYRAAAPRGLTIEYVGRPPTDGWAVLETMWDTQNVKIEVEEALAIVAGSEAACHNRNKLRGTAVVIETIELYRFDDGHLTVRYFIRPPAGA
jgi:hypothetical protein